MLMAADISNVARVRVMKFSEGLMYVRRCNDGHGGRRGQPLDGGGGRVVGRGGLAGYPAAYEQRDRKGCADDAVNSHLKLSHSHVKYLGEEKPRPAFRCSNDNRRTE